MRLAYNYTKQFTKSAVTKKLLLKTTHVAVIENALTLQQYLLSCEDVLKCLQNSDYAYLSLLLKKKKKKRFIKQPCTGCNCVQLSSAKKKKYKCNLS